MEVRGSKQWICGTKQRGELECEGFVASSGESEGGEEINWAGPYSLMKAFINEL